MMTKQFKRQLIGSFFLLLIQDCHAAPAPLFDILVRGSELTIRTTDRFNYFPYAGIRINSPGVSINLAKLNCIPMKNKFCIFGVSNFMPVNIKLRAKPGPVCLTLCLNSEAVNHCQNYNLMILPRIPLSAQVIK
jgi:hypothetical protein